MTKANVQKGIPKIFQDTPYLETVLFHSTEDDHLRMGAICFKSTQSTLNSITQLITVGLFHTIGKCFLIITKSVTYLTCPLFHFRDLLAKFDAHINVEAVGSVGAIKYLFKYITKGPDMIMVNKEMTGRERPELDEITQHINASCYLSLIHI